MANGGNGYWIQKLSGLNISVPNNRSFQAVQIANLNTIGKVV